MKFGPQQPVRQTRRSFRRADMPGGRQLRGALLQGFGRVDAGYIFAVIPDGAQRRSGTHSVVVTIQHGFRVRAFGSPRNDGVHPSLPLNLGQPPSARRGPLMQGGG